MKRLIVFGLALGLIAAVIGCEPGTVPNPTVTPIITPHASPIIPSTTPGTPAATAPNEVPNNNIGTTANPQAMTIPDFKEGTAVMMTDIPLVRNAFEERYKDHSVVGVTHAMQGNEQVYRVEYKDAQGKVQEAYIYPEGNWYGDNYAAPASANTVE